MVRVVRLTINVTARGPRRDSIWRRMVTLLAGSRKRAAMPHPPIASDMPSRLRQPPVISDMPHPPLVSDMPHRQPPLVSDMPHRQPPLVSDMPHRQLPLVSDMPHPPLVSDMPVRHWRTELAQTQRSAEPPQSSTSEPRCEAFRRRSAKWFGHFFGDRRSNRPGYSGSDWFWSRLFGSSGARAAAPAVARSMGTPIAAAVSSANGDRFRLRLVWGVALVLVALVFIRLFTIQVVWYPRYSILAKRQHMTAYKIAAARGTIYDRNGRPLAVSQEGAAVYMIPRYFLADRKRMRENLRELCDILGRSPAQVEREASRKSFLWLKKPASPAEVQWVQDLVQRRRIQGVGWEPLCLRHYPEGPTASQLLGFTNDEGRGLEGIEFGYDRYLYLSGKRMKVLRDSRGKLIFAGGGPREHVNSESSITLTIDITLQHAAERELAIGVERVKARWGTAIVMDPATGELLAIANVPGYVPTDFRQVPAAMRANHAVTAVFEPGSIFKLVTLAAVLQECLAKESDVYDCERGAYLLGGEVIHDVAPYGKLSVAEMFAYSSNIGFAKLSQKLGCDRMLAWAKVFGFGERTGVGLPGEERGLLRKASDKFTLAAQAFGQGLGVTAIQVVAAYGAIANGGVRMRPYVIREVRDADGRVRVSNRAKSVRRVVSADVARRATEMMVGVVEHGTGRAGRIKGYRVAAKTGTAQKSTSKGYAEKGEKIITFVGFLPADAPRFLVLVTIDHPRWGSAGGVAGPVFREIALAALRQFGVPRSLPGVQAFDRAGEEGLVASAREVGRGQP